MNPLLAEAQRAVRETSTTTRPLSVSDVIVKTGVLLLVLLVGAGVGWLLLPYNWLVIIALGIGAVFLAIAAVRKRTPGPGLPAAYSLVEGLIIGSFSALMATLYGNGIVTSALLATLSVFVVVLAINFIPAVRNSGKGRKFFGVVILAYLLLSLVSLGFAVFAGTGDGWGFFGLGTFGLLLSAGAVALSAWSLLLSFSAVDDALRMEADEGYGWLLSMGLIVSIAWVYLELLRFLGLARR